MATCEEEDKDQADGGPDVAILNQWCYVWPRNAYETDGAKECGSEGNVEHIIYGAMNLRMWAVGEMASDPGAYLFRRLRSNGRKVSHGRSEEPSF
jgi:hypothetical protein